MLLSGKAAAYFSTLTRPERVKCFVLDDSVIPRGKSKKVELLSFVHDHALYKTVRGFNLLLLGWTDGYSFLPVAFNTLPKLGKEFHGVSYDLTVSSAALVFARFILLEWIRRKHNGDLSILQATYCQ